MPRHSHCAISTTFSFFTCTYLPLMRCFQPNSTFKIDLEALLDLQTVPSTVVLDWSPERFPLLFSASLRRSILSSKFGLWVRNAIKASWSPIAFNPSSLKWDSFILLTARPSIYKTNENNTLKPQGAICLYYEEWLDSWRYLQTISMISWSQNLMINCTVNAVHMP